MSQQYKPVACKGNCGKDIIFEKQADGKWLVSEFDVENWVKLEKHNCPNYKAQLKPFEQRGEGTSWSGTNKQGQMFEARVHKELDTTAQTNNDLILKMLTDISRKLDEQNKNIFKLFDNQLVQGQNILEILGLLQDQFIKKGNDIDDGPDSHQAKESIAKKQEDEYGF